MPRPSRRDGDSRKRLLTQLAGVVDELQSVEAPGHQATRNRFREAVLAEVERLEQAANRLDPVLRPRSLFNPSEPATSGRIVALAMVAQPRHSLATLQAFYGAGVYGLYYNGPFDAYADLSRTEQPIYIGKADPADAEAKDAISQGVKLFGRLSEHRRNLAKATSTLRVEDFECRFLIVQTGYQKAAEDYLINFFKPIWNSEVKICFGLGKHGDDADTRANKRSPWDTMHPGRAWAAGLAGDQKPEHQIRAEIATHLARVPPHATIEAIIADFLGDLEQLVPAGFTTANDQLVTVDEGGPPPSDTGQLF